MFKSALVVVPLVVAMLALVTIFIFVLAARAHDARAGHPRPRLVVIDANGPIVGKATRAQWRLRRRTLLEAALICDALADESVHDKPIGEIDARVCAWRIRERVAEYDRQSPEFSELERGFIIVPEKVA